MKKITMPSTYKRYFKLYQFLAFQTFNTLILILTVNLLLAGIFWIRDSYYKKFYMTNVDRKVQSYREMFSDLQAYSQLSSTDANRYLDEQGLMGGIGFQYAPWVQFRNPEFHGEFLNTNSRGFRKTLNSRSQDRKAVNIFVFGGSTTFGYGVPDVYTIPSYMQKILEHRYPQKTIRVHNYGQGFYYSSQEMILLLWLIKEGGIPDWAIFIDGGNDTYQLHFGHDQPWFTGEVKRLWDTRRGAIQPESQPKRSWIPMVRLAQGISRRLSSQDTNKTSQQTVPPPQDKQNGGAEERRAQQNIVEYIVQRYTNNMRMIRAICREYEIQCYFVWHPVPFYKYDRSFHKTFPYQESIPEYWHRVYFQMEFYSTPDFLYLGDMLQGVSEKVFVDDVHYNEKYNEKIARRICEHIHLDEQSLTYRGRTE